RIEREIALRPDNVYAVAHGAIVLAYLGQKERTRRWALRARTIEPNEAGDLYSLACALALIDEVDEALDILEDCGRTWPPEMVNWEKRATDVVSRHGHPRYQAFIPRGEARLAATQAERGATSG